MGEREYRDEDGDGDGDKGGTDRHTRQEGRSSRQLRVQF